jgi:hypothetical protein
MINTISCSKCGGNMPELRKIKFGYDFCIECSDKYNLIGKKRAITVQKGEGDHTWNETIIMSEEEFRRYEKQEELNSKILGKSKESSIDSSFIDDFINGKNIINTLKVDPKEE